MMQEITWSNHPYRDAYREWSTHRWTLHGDEMQIYYDIPGWTEEEWGEVLRRLGK